jgi:hypothetical protein
MSKFSRRSIVALTAGALPALAVPAFAVQVDEPAKIAPAVSGPTAIGRLYDELRALRRQVRAEERRQEKLEAEVLVRLPKPHPSIVYSLPENDADGLAWTMKHSPPSPNSYIDPLTISMQLEDVVGERAVIEKVDGDIIAIYPQRTQPLSEKAIAHRDRLLARLELAKDYKRQVDRMERKVGWTQSVRKLEDRMYPRIGELERRIYSEPAVTQNDLRIKLELYSADDSADDWLARRLLRDFRRLMKSQRLSA